MQTCPQSSEITSDQLHSVDDADSLYQRNIPEYLVGSQLFKRVHVQEYQQGKRLCTAIPDISPSIVGQYFISESVKKIFDNLDIYFLTMLVT